MKKLLLGALMALLLPVVAFAEGEAEVATTTLNDYLDPAKVTLNLEGAEMIETEDGGYSFNDASFNGVVCFGEIDGIIEADMSFNLADGPEDWIGFQMRSATTDQRCWMTKNYLAIVKSTNIELQVFDGKTRYVSNFDYKMPLNTKMNVKMGVIPVEDGVYYFIKLGDKLFGSYVKSDVVLEPGYFCADGAISGMTIYETEPVAETISPIDISFDAATSKIVVNKADDAANVNWYLSTDEFNFDATTLWTTMEQFELVEDYNETELLLADNEIGKYVYAGVQTETYEAYTTVVYADPIEYVKAHGLIAKIGYTKLAVKGETFDYDTNPKVYPDEYDGAVFIPFRGVMDAFGFPVQWDEAERVVTLTTPDQNTDTKFSVDKRGYISYKGLMVSGMKEAPKLIQDRTFLDIYDTAGLVALDNVVYDEDSGLIVFTKIALELTDDQITQLSYYMDEI